jgi:murein L,D-transpeptidase YcbB/YkuD
MRSTSEIVMPEKKQPLAVVAWCRLVLAGLVLLGLVLPCPAMAQTPAPIERLVSAATLDGMHRPDFREYQPSVREFYAANDYAPAWLQGNAPSSQALVMIQLFRDAWKKGLDPEDYDASRWDERQQALQREDTAAAFDVALTVSAMRYASDLHIGRVNPSQVDFGLSVEQKKYDLAQFLRDQLLPSSDPTAVVNGVEPPFAGYQRTEASLVRYVALAQQDDGEKLPVPAKAIEPGQPYDGLARLARFLRRVGDLPAETSATDTPQVYEPQLVEGVKRFQRRHGLDADGRLGAATVKELNVPLAERVHQLQLALERWRWLPSQFSSPPIIVNIPDFRLRVLDDSNAVAMEMRVVVGKAMRTETPAFSRDMTYVVLRPYWGVPPGIMRRSIIPALKRDRDYVAKNRYEVVTYDGTVVTSGTVSDEVLASLQAGKLTVRQKPGPKNALGLVKLMFPNEHHVYLHSTPAPELFARSRRDFSAGCIRVEQPAQLTAWALRNNPGWSLERVQQAMQSGPDNVTVKLAQSIPVFIVYGTAIAYPDEEVHFYDDLYGHDQRLTEALSRR